MLERLYRKSEVWFAVVFILAYVIGNSYFMQASEYAGIDMIYTIPYNLVLLAVMYFFLRRNHLFSYYGVNGVKCSADRVLYYVPLVVIASVNLWMGICFKMDALHSVVYFSAMILTGIAEEMLFRGFLLRAMCRNSVKRAVIVTSLLFGIGHIVNLFNGNSTDYIATVCQLFYAAAIGFLFAAVLFASKSILPCMITHSMLNALSTFSNEAALDRIQIPVSAALCVVSGISAYVIFRKYKHSKDAGLYSE